MKKLSALLLTITALLFCVSCTQEKTVPDSNQTAPFTDARDNVEDTAEQPDRAEKTSAGYTVELSDKRTVVLGSEADSVLASLGEYSDMYEAPSCIREGYDRVYIYDGFSVTSSPDEDGTDRITEFSVDSADCVLGNGITVGSAVDEMKAAYGEDYQDSFGFITYELDGAVASFVTDGEKITNIVFTYAK